jgi:hypothetical protein
MKCEECLQVIEDYFDGELEERAATHVRRHLTDCEACARALEALADEHNLYVLYTREVEVAPALWTAVAARIREEGAARRAPLLGRWRQRLAELFGTPRLSPALTFALLILAVGATAGLMKFMQSRTAQTEPVAQQRPSIPAPSMPKAGGGGADSRGAETESDKEGYDVETDKGQSARRGDGESEYKAPPILKTADVWADRRAVVRPEGLTGKDSPDQLVREAEQKYMAAIAMLSRDAKRRRTQLEPDMRVRFDQTLAAVDRTISETRRAARRQPDDPVAVQYMLAAYAKKVEVLKEMAVYRVDERDMQ